MTLPDSAPGNGSPSTVAADTNGTVYVGLGQQGSGLNSDIAEFDANGNFVRVFGAQLPGGNPLLAVGPDHNVYAWANSTFGPIDEYNPAGALIRTIAIPTTIVRLTDLELDSAGNIVATGYDNNGSSWKVFRFDPSGNETAAFAVGPAGDPLNGLAVDPDGTVWVVRQTNDVSVLSHFDLSGRDLKNAPYLGVLDGGSIVRDIDYSDGRLYAIGYGDPILGPPDVRGKVVVSTLTPSGWLLSKVVGPEFANYCCHGQYYSVAANGNHVWATGLDTSALASKLTPARSMNIRPFDARAAIGAFGEDPLVNPDPDSVVSVSCATVPVAHGIADAEGGLVPQAGTTITIPTAGHTGCDIYFSNHGNPCGSGAEGTPVGLFQNGNLIGEPFGGGPSPSGYTTFGVDPDKYGSGPVYAGWVCTLGPGGTSGVVYEKKGDIELYDPSGAVVDARTGRAIAGATVLLQVSAGGPHFGTPSFGDIRPQANPELTGSGGSFGWDVAPGRWRVKVTAFGYRPYASRSYDVPPPVTGLKLKLRRDPAQQRYLIDPKGRAGPVALAGKARRVSGLRIRAVHGRVRGITIISKRFRTEFGIRLGSAQADVNHAYPQPALKALKRKPKKNGLSYHVGRATFLVRGGRVVRIVLGRA